MREQRDRKNRKETKRRKEKWKKRNDTNGNVRVKETLGNEETRQEKGKH